MSTPTSQPVHTHTCCVAPMMAVTDRHQRMLMRLLSRSARLYTEMLTTGAVIHGDRDRLLGFDAREQPVALQLGGSDPDAMAACAEYAERAGYVEANINAGCPSERVQAGRFGACLMREPALVAECVRRMRAACSLPITVKCRIGVDDHDRFEDLLRFADAVHEAGCEVLIVHARKAWLKGLSPRENREIPPLDYARVYALKRLRPELHIVINGGITDFEAASAHLREVDGIMLGRAAWHDPYVMAGADTALGRCQQAPPEREAIALAMRAYASEVVARGGRLAHVTRALVGLYAGQPGGRRWRRILSEQAHRRGAGPDVIDRALDAQREAAASAARYAPAA